MTRLISVHAVVRVPDEVVRNTEGLRSYLETGLFSEIDGSLRIVEDITDEIVASIGEESARKRGLIG